MKLCLHLIFIYNSEMKSYISSETLIFVKKKSIYFYIKDVINSKGQIIYTEDFKRDETSTILNTRFLYKFEPESPNQDVTF